MSAQTPRRRTHQRSVYCSAEEQEAIRAEARAAGRTVSRHVLERVHADDPERHRLVLSEAQQTEILEGVRLLDGFVRELLRPLPEYGGRTLMGVVAQLAGERER